MLQPATLAAAAVGLARAKSSAGFEHPLAGALDNPSLLHQAFAKRLVARSRRYALPAARRILNPFG